jgi:hypothetical protein
MDPWLKALNVLACAAVLAASGWWGWSQWQAGRPGAAMVEPAAVEAVLADLAAWQDECQAIVEAWDRGERPELVDQLGPSVVARVERCRSIVEMRPHEWATD